MTHLKVWFLGAALAAAVASFGWTPARPQGVREYLRSWVSELPTLEDAARKDRLHPKLFEQRGIRRREAARRLEPGPDDQVSQRV